MHIYLLVFYGVFTVYFYIYCTLTLGLKSRVYGVPNEINDDDDESIVPSATLLS